MKVVQFFKGIFVLTPIETLTFYLFILLFIVRKLDYGFSTNLGLLGWVIDGFVSLFIAIFVLFLHSLMMELPAIVAKIKQRRHK